MVFISVSRSRVIIKVVKLIFDSFKAIQMLSRFVPVLLFSVFVLQATAQLHDNEYRSSTNPLYWQNRKPDKDYWQQDVQYKIDANIDETDNSITAKENLFSAGYLNMISFILFSFSILPSLYSFPTSILWL